MNTEHITTPRTPYYETADGRRALITRALEGMEIDTRRLVCGVPVELKEREHGKTAYWWIRGGKYSTLAGAATAVLRAIRDGEGC